MVFDTHLQKGGQDEGLTSTAVFCKPSPALPLVFSPAVVLVHGTEVPQILKQQTIVLMTNSTSRNNGIAKSPELGLCFFGNGKVKRLFCHFCIVISVDISP